MRQVRVILTVVALVTAVVVPAPDSAAVGEIEVTRITRSVLPRPVSSGDDVSDTASITADGSLVAFRSNATNIVEPSDRSSAVYVRELGAASTERVASGRSPVISGDGTHVAYSSGGGVYVVERETGTTTLVSVDRGGGQADGTSADPSIDADGSVVAFTSQAKHLVSGDTNDVEDVFVRDLTARTTVRASVARDGTEADGPSSEPSISGDGTRVAFVSEASNLVAGDTNGVADVFVRDLVSGTTTRISVGDGAQANGASGQPGMAFGGSHVVFTSTASNLVSGDTNGRDDVFVHDLTTGRTTRVSVTDTGAQADNRSDSPSISGDGRVVAFTSNAGNLVAGDTNGRPDAFVRDLTTRSTRRVSVADDGSQLDVPVDARATAISATGTHVTFQRGFGRGDDVYVRDLVGSTTSLASAGNDDRRTNGPSANADVSLDGSRIALVSEASNLVVDDTNDEIDVFVHDLATDTTSRASVSSSGEQADGPSAAASLTADGSVVAFASMASNLVEGDTNDDWDIFVRDIATGTIRRVNLNRNGGESSRGAQEPEISADGSRVVFTSEASGMVDGDTNGVRDVFVRDLATGANTRVSVSSSGVQADGPSSSPSINHDGTLVVFSSAASNLVPGDTNGVADVFLHDLTTGVTTRVSVSTDGTQGGSSSDAPVISADGSTVVFESRSTELIPEPISGLFRRDLAAGVTTRVGRAHPRSRYDGNADISADGSRVVYTSYENDELGAGAEWLFLSEIVAVDVTGETTRVAGWDSFSSSISGDGSTIAFSSTKTFSRNVRRTDVYLARVTETDVTDVLCQGLAPTISGAGTIVGTDGDDVIVGSPGDDVIDAGAGNDRVCGGDGRDTVLGGPGDDRIMGDGGNDRLAGGPGADVLLGGPGSDTADYSASTAPIVVIVNHRADDGAIGEGDRVDPSVESIVGSPFDDVLIGSPEGNSIDGGDGDDLIRGRAGADRLDGGEGDDRIIGGLGRDSLEGGGGTDYCRGSAGLDRYARCEQVDP